MNKLSENNRLYRTRFTVILVVMVVSTVIVIMPALAQGLGTYIGKVVAQWLPDGRNMKLVEPFAYIDPEGTRWDAPSGSIINGASIPRLAWSIIGGPFEGKYRNASVIHDVACDEKARSWESVHRAFYTAMLVSGVYLIEAKIMYGAVYFFGPRWLSTSLFESLTIEQPTPGTLVEQDFEKLKAFIRDKNPSLEQIEAYKP